MGYLAILSAIFTGAISIILLYQVRLDGQNKLTRHGRTAVILIIVTTLIATILAISNEINLNSEKRRVEERDAKLTQLSTELEQARDYVQIVQATNGQLGSQVALLQKEANRLEASLKNASELTLNAMPQRIVREITNTWEKNEAVMGLKLSSSASSFALVPLALTDEIDGKNFGNRDRTFKFTIVNVRPDDMMAVAFNIAEYSRLWGLVLCGPYFKHGDSVEVHKAKYQASYYITINSNSYRQFKEIIDRNPKAGIVMTLSE